MEDLFKQTKNLYKLLLFNVCMKPPVTTKEMVLKTLRRVGNFCYIINSIAYTLINLPMFQQEEHVSFFKNQQFLWGLNLALGTSIVTFRYSAIFWNEEKILKLLDTWSGAYTEEDFKKYGIKRRVVILSRFIRFYQRYIIIQIVLAFIRAFNDLLFTGKEAALGIKVPFSVENNFIFTLSFVWLYFNQCTPMLCNFITDSTICVLTVVATIEIDIWRKDFTDTMKLIEFDIKKKLPDLAERHNKIITFIGDIEQVYSLTFLNLLLVSSMILCSALFQFISFTDITWMSLNLSYSTIILLMIFFICFCGQLLQDAGERIEMDVYACGWEILKDVGIKKQIWLILMKSQKKLGLTFMNFCDATIMQFGEVLKTTYSYFMLFWNLKDN